MHNAATIPLRPATVPPPAPVEKLLDVDAAAEILGVSDSTIRRLIRSGELRAIKLGPQVLRVEPGAIRELLDRRATS